MNILRVNTEKELLYIETSIGDYTISIADMLSWRDLNSMNKGRLHRINSSIAVIRNELEIAGKSIREIDGQEILDRLRILRDCGYYSVPAEL